MKNKLKAILIIALSIILTSSIIDMNNLYNYQDQTTPTYISNDNTLVDNQITNEGATLGRVLFYDKKLSKNNTISCGSCHLQEFAFGDTAKVSTGVNGVTGRHSMRLINARYSNESNAFWDERATSFEDQSTKPIQDHVEMGFSGTNGDPDFNDLIIKLSAIDYYTTLFKVVYGDTVITEDRVQKALAQFIRSIESYDSKFDTGRAQVSSINSSFPNYTTLENQGKDLFLLMPPLGGAGCVRCHEGEEFSMITNCNNNGVIGVADDTNSVDLTNTKAPTLRDLVNPQGAMNGPFMHDGSLKTLMDVINHYNDLTDTISINTNLDFRLAGPMHILNLTQNEKDALVAFLLTLTGNNVYTDTKYSDPFDAQGNITVNYSTSIAKDVDNKFDISIFPNPVQNSINIELEKGDYQLSIVNINGDLMKKINIKQSHVEDISDLNPGVYIVNITNNKSKKIYSEKIIKN